METHDPPAAEKDPTGSGSPAALREATRELHSAAARVYATGNLTSEEVQAVRRLLKAGRYSRCQTPESRTRLIAVYRARARELRERESMATAVATTHEPSPPAHASEPTPVDQDAAPARGKRHWCSTKRNPKPWRDRELDELSEKQRIWLRPRIRLMRQLDRDVPLPDALAETGLALTSRQVRTLRGRWKTEGVAGLYDRRWANGRPKFDDRVRFHLEALAIVFRKAKAPALHRRLKKKCKAWRTGVPSASWVRDQLRDLDPALKAIRKGGMEHWDRTMAPRAVRTLAQWANEVWFIDHRPLDNEVNIQQRDGTWVRARPWLTLVIDVFSRAPMGFVLSVRNPDAWTVALALLHAISPKRNPKWKMRGVCGCVVLDNGSDFRSAAAESSIEGVTELVFTGVHSPNEHAEVERPFWTIDDGLLSAMYGYIRAGRLDDSGSGRRSNQLPTLPELRSEIESFLVDEYLTRVHEGLSRGQPFDRRPGEVWESTVKLRLIPAEKLQVLLLQSHLVRTITKEGIRLTSRTRGREAYNSPAIAKLVGRKVRVSFNPDDMESVLVYDAHTKKFLGEAWASGSLRYSGPDIVNARHELRADIKERTQAYKDEVEENDRPEPKPRQRKQKSPEAAGDCPSSRAQHAASPPSHSTVPQGALDLMERLKRRDRNAPQAR